MKRALFGFLVLAIAFLIAAPATAMDVEWPDTLYPTLQDAINAAGEGGTITVKAGTHEVGPTDEPYESYRLLEGQTIKGEGYDAAGLPVSKLRFVGPYKFLKRNGYRYAWGIWAGADNVTVNGLAFEGENLTGDGQWVTPILVSGDFYAQVVTNATIIGNHILGPFPYFGIDLSNCMNSLISGNVIKSGRYGIYVSDHPTDVPPTGITISDNTIINRSIGIYVIGRPAPVTGNTFSGNSIQGGNYSIYLQSADNNQINGNKIDSPSQRGVFVYRSNTNTVTGNTFIGSGYAQGVIRLWGYSDDSPTANNIFADNDLSGAKTTGPQVYLNGYSHNNTFTDNTFGGGDKVILCEGHNNTIKDYKIDGSAIGTANYGIYLDGSAHNNTVCDINFNELSISNEYIYCGSGTLGNSFTDISFPEGTPDAQKAYDEGDNVFDLEGTCPEE